VLRSIEDELPDWLVFALEGEALKSLGRNDEALHMFQYAINNTEMQHLHHV
jgi:hypothetical protein